MGREFNKTQLGYTIMIALIGYVSGYYGHKFYLWFNELTGAIELLDLIQTNHDKLGLFLDFCRSNEANPIYLDTLRFRYLFILDEDSCKVLSYVLQYAESSLDCSQIRGLPIGNLSWKYYQYYILKIL